MQPESFDDPAAVARAIDAVREGRVVGAHFGTVFGLIVDGAHAGVADEVMRIKGALRGHKPLGVCLAPADIPTAFDPSTLSPRLRELIAAPWFGQRTAAMIAVRGPLNPDAGIPEPLRSHVDGVDRVQVFDPTRMPGAADLIAAMQRAGVDWVAATSMNDSGQTEIVDTDDALDFARRHGLELLFGPAARHAASGSLPIVELDRDRIRLARHGIIAADDLAAALGQPLHTEDAIPAHFPPLAVPSGTLDGLEPADAAAHPLALLYPVSVSRGDEPAGAPR